MITASVIMSVYNESLDWVKNSIDSIINQTFQDFEFIIILDKPDNIEVKKYIQSISGIDPRIAFYINETNIGLTKSLNKGIDLSKGKYIIRMDADDISLKNRFQKQITFMDNNPEILVSGGNIEQFGRNSKIVNFQTASDDIFQNFIIPSPLYTPLAHPAVIIRATVFKDLNLKYDEKFLVAQDYRLWGQVLKVGKIANISDVILKYRISDSQASAIKKNLQKENRSKVIIDYIEFFISKKIEQRYLVPNIISITDIKLLKQYYDSNDELYNNLLDNIILCYFLSLNKYSLKTLVYFCTHIFFNIRTPFRLKITIMLNHFRTNQPVLRKRS